MLPKKIMIIDDDKEFLEELRETLALSGYETSGFSSSAFAMEKLPEVNPDVILLDLKMDEKSGFAIADELSHLPETARIPIVAMTGIYTESEYQKLMNVCGFRGAVIKPFHPLDIIARIEDVSRMQ